jgi:hypothetical protein
MHKILGLVLLVATVAGCGADGNASVTPATEQSTDATVSATSTTAAMTTVPPTTVAPTTAAPTTVPEPTTTTIPPPTPAEMYLEFVTPMNCAGQQLNSAFDAVIGDDGFTQREWPTVQAEVLPVVEGNADVIVDWMENMVTYPWPADVKADIDVLVAGNAQLAHQYGSVVAAQSIDEWNAAWELTVPDTVATAAVVRAKLGLPTNLTDTQDWCALAGNSVP